MYNRSCWLPTQTLTRREKKMRRRGRAGDVQEELGEGQRGG